MGYIEVAELGKEDVVIYDVKSLSEVYKQSSKLVTQRNGKGRGDSGNLRHADGTMLSPRGTLWHPAVDGTVFLPV